MNFPLQPLGLNLIVRRLDNIQRTSAGIYLPETAQEKQQFGQIMAVGTEISTRYLRPNWLVLFEKYTDRFLEQTGTRTEIIVDGRPYLVLRMEEILGVIQDQKFIRELTSETP
jgi:chaperonin GroES